MEIWEEIISDAERGACRLVVEYGDRLLTAAQRITQNAADAEDLVFRTFSHAVRKIETYNGSSAFFSWIYSIMLNFRRSDLRRKAANALDFMDELPDGQDPGPDPAELLVMRSSAELVRKAVDALPETLRTTLILHYYEDYGVSAIAALMNVPVGTVKFRLHEARRQMARWLVQTEFKDRASYNNGDERRKRQFRQDDKGGAS